MSNMEKFKQDVLNIVNAYYDRVEGEIDSIIAYQKLKREMLCEEIKERDNKIIDIITALKISVQSKNQNNIDNAFDVIELLLKSEISK
jgi:hypothetical protein